MRSNQNFNKKWRGHRAWLYSLVFATKASTLIVLFLLCSFFVQPFHKALAEETDTAVGTVAIEQPVAEDVKEQIEPVPDPEPVVDPIATEELSEVDAEQEEDVSPQEESEEVGVEDIETAPVSESTTTEQEMIDATEEDGEQETVASTTSATQEITTNGSDTVTATSTSAATSTTGGNHGGGSSSSELEDSVSQTASTTDEQSSESASATSTDDTESDMIVAQDTVDELEDSASLEGDEEAELVLNVNSDDIDVDTTTTLTPGLTVDGQYVVTDENYYQFSRQSCVAVGNGTYHCSVSSDVSVDSQSIVFAEIDTDGDMEIYLRTKRDGVEQITDNNFDDMSPYLDIESMQIVWQRFIDGRYQIILYDLQNRTERQLTFSRTNNMEPKVSNAGIVWQSWDGNDWEIMYFDGLYTDQLTDNLTQDVAPAIEDDYVLWSVLGKSDQEAMVYSISTGETVIISGHEGGTIENPRFVLVYDTKFDNGDVVTQGFDPTTGLSAPIAAKAAPEPVEIPETDPIGEIRALIQNKSNQKGEEVVHQTPPDGSLSDLNLATTTTHASGTLDITQMQLDQADGDLTAAATSTENQVPVFELTEYDLVIVPTSTPSTTNNGSVQVVVSTTSSSTQP